MTNEQTDRFDRIVGTLIGLPGVKHRKPSTVMDALPIVGNVTTYVVQSFRIDEEGKSRVVAALQIVDADGKNRLILPDKVVGAIVRQRESLFDRSTPQSRERKARARARAKRKAEREARKIRAISS